MLGIYRNLFSELRQRDISYIVYKGLEHLELDLKGEGGDIDLLIAESSFLSFDALVKELGFVRHRSKLKRSVHYFSVDAETGKTAKLDVDWFVKVGDRPFVTKYIDIEIDRIRCSVNQHSIQIVHASEYPALYFLMKITSNKRAEKHFSFLRDLVSADRDVEHGYFYNLLMKIGVDFAAVSSKVAHAQGWGAFQEEEQLIKKFAQVDPQRKNLKQFHFAKRVYSKILKACGGVQERIRRKGKLVAFVGVDGAGKSSAIDHILGIDYFKYTGIKRVYFGNNEYWIPGLQKLLKSRPKFRPIQLLAIGLSLIDKRLRTYIALYYMLLGNLVLADRYYYDDVVGRQLAVGQGRKDGFIKRQLKKLLYDESPRVPDMTIFLNVAPEIAYTRKQDYPFDVMVKINSEYCKVMSRYPEVSFVDAGRSIEVVRADIISKIFELDGRVN